MQPLTNSGMDAAAAGPPGPALVYMPVPVRSRIYDRYLHRQSIGLGITQIIIGILCFIFNSVCLGVAAVYIQGNGLGVVGHGYWCGIMFLITGVFGITAGKKKTRCHIVTFMVLCIISATMTIALLVVGIIGAITTDRRDCSDYYNYGYYYNGYPNYRWVCNNVPYSEVIIAMESCLAIMGLIEVVVAIWGSALCCGAGVCCCSRPAMTMPTVGYLPYSGQMISISQTQGGPYVYAPQHTFAYPQGLLPASAYVQTGWTMPATNIGPAYGHAPPPYAANHAQPLWMIPPAMTNPGPMTAQAPPNNLVPSQTGEIKGTDEASCA